MALLTFWWMLLVWGGAIIIFFVVRYWLTKQSKRKHTALEIPVAHSARLTELPEYRVAFKRYRLMARWTAVILGLSLLSTIILTARPALISAVNPIQENRDIMLCLDASGSVLKTDTALIKRFSALVNTYNGQRFGLTLFNSSAATVIPLNDNYQLITDQLKLTAEAFQSQKGDTFDNLTNGTLAGFSAGTSLASDGLASCVQHMDTNGQLRSQSIVLATDNEVNGTAIVGMTQAIALAKDKGIHVFVIDPGVSEPKLSGDHNQLKLVASQTGGAYYMLKDASTVDALITAIGQQKPEKFTGLPQPAINDNPKPWLYAAVVLMVASLLLLWRLEL